MANDLQLVEYFPPVECLPPVECVTPMPPAEIKPLWDPPEQQIICKLIEIRLLFLEKLDYLSYALSDTHPSQEATKILQDIRKLAGNLAGRLSFLTIRGYFLAMEYLDFLDTLQRKGHLSGPLDNLLDCTKSAWGTMQTVQQAMVVLRGELGSAMCRITTAQMGGENEGALKSPLFAIDNIEVIAELFDAIDECIELLPPWFNYFLNMANDRILNRNPVCTIPPSEEEIQTMEAKWKSFQDASEPESRIQERSLEARIQNLPRDYGRPRFWRRACKVLRRVSVKRLGQSTCL